MVDVVERDGDTRTIQFHARHIEIPVEREGGAFEPWRADNPYWPYAVQMKIDMSEGEDGWPRIISAEKLTPEMCDERDERQSEQPGKVEPTEPWPEGEVIDAEYRTIPLRCRLGWHRWRVWVQHETEQTVMPLYGAEFTRIIKTQESECLRCLRKRSRSVET